MLLTKCLQVHEALLKNIKRRMTPQPVKIRADVELTCFAYDGVERIRWEEL
jgi:translation initiation factor 2 subunit 1